jgi:3-hydroxyisobutyrate dehydrogenase-like beta-hydroxyacid dehydrogenase
VTYLDATVAASSEQMRNGEAVLLIGGPSEAVQGPAALWDALAARWFHVGPCGNGASMKLVSNLVMGLNRAALAEGLALADACGLDLELTLQVLHDGNAWSRVLDLKGRKMITRDFAPQARLRQHLKDVELIRALAERVHARTPLSDTHASMLTEAVDKGLGDLDNSALIEALRK